MSDRKQFEHWYVTNVFDFENNPIGSRECALKWEAWQARGEQAADEIERLQQHNDALSEISKCGCAYDDADDICVYHAEKIAQGITKGTERLQQRIAELEKRGEPVAWMHAIDTHDKEWRRGFEVYYEKTPGFCIPLYLAAPSPEDK